MLDSMYRRLCRRNAPEKSDEEASPAFLVLLVVLVILGCNLPTGGSRPASTEASTPAPTPTAASGPSPTPKSLDLAHKPLYWKAPLTAKSPAGETDGSTDFMDLLKPHAPWATAASYPQVFKRYGGWAARDSTIFQLTRAVQGIRQRGLALAVEVGPLSPTHT